MLSAYHQLVAVLLTVIDTGRLSIVRHGTITTQVQLAFSIYAVHSIAKKITAIYCCRTTQQRGLLCSPRVSISGAAGLAVSLAHMEQHRPLTPAGGLLDGLVISMGRLHSGLLI